MNLNTEQYFSTVPQIHCPRSVFDRSFTYKTTFNADYLVPIFIDEALPGDSMRLSFTAFGRLLNPLVVPVMDELYFETLWFKIPNRLVWTHWVNFCGEQENPGDSTDYVLPTINSGQNGFAVGSIFDMFGLPVNVPNLEVNSLPLRCYQLVYNQWFRAEQLINSVSLPLGDSDDVSNYHLLKSAKIHDYFTSALISGTGGDVMLPLGSYAPLVSGSVVDPSGDDNDVLLKSNGSLRAKLPDVTGSTKSLFVSSPTLNGTSVGNNSNNGNHIVMFPTDSNVSQATALEYSSGMYGKIIGGYADLSHATGASYADFVFGMKLQQYKIRMNLSGNRYIEYLKAIYNVDSPDARLQRAEFLGSTREMIDINTVVQTSATSSASPQGNLTAYGVVANHGAGFNTSFTEHSYLLGLCRVRHNPVYQQGLHKMWTRSVLLDFYNPLFNGISEQPIKNSELVAQGGNVLNSAGTPVDDDAFGFQEAWAEYRYKPSMITGQLRSGITQSLDVYHLAQYFVDENDHPKVPLLNQSFIEESVPMDRVLAIETGKNIPQFVFDFRFNYQCARPMPVRNIMSTLADHF